LPFFSFSFSIVITIDYNRTYTWKESAEKIGKSFVGPASTVQPPDVYKRRFRIAMDRYFMIAPDQQSRAWPSPTDGEDTPFFNFMS